MKPEIINDIHYDALQSLLQENNFAVSCTLVQVDSKLSLTRLFQIFENKDLTMPFLKALIDSEIQRCSKY